MVCPDYHGPAGKIKHNFVTFRYKVNLALSAFKNSTVGPQILNSGLAGVASKYDRY